LVRHPSVAGGTASPAAGPLSGLVGTVRRVPMKVSEIVRLLEQDGWTLKRTTGSHRHFTHPTKAGLVTVAGKPSATLKPKTEASILNQAGLPKGQP
jgi:predicted RNA binding protein YcfA (HicA-like mRNA interferase family)